MDTAVAHLLDEPLDCPFERKLQSIPVGTILYHQRYNGVFKEHRDKPYAPVNYFSRYRPFYGETNTETLNTYEYKVVKEIPNVLEQTATHCPDNINEWVKKISSSISSIDSNNIHSYLPWLEFGIRGFFHDFEASCGSNEYRLTANAVRSHLELSSAIINDKTEPEVEHGEKWLF